ncbi:MAG: class I SAM-dependent methyltransferase [Candidatus Stahlbacteria bacterium]|nr:class I SAM-dependent methyltransferase [Candidatus Stahlbacteria bacterium]
MDNYEHIWLEWSHEDIDKQIEEHLAQRYPFLNLIYECFQYLNSNEVKVLEVGCGSSIDTHIIAQKIDGQVWGVDISQKAIEIAHQVSKYFDKKVILDVQDVRRLKFEDNFFDLVFSQGVLEHLDDINKAIEEHLRVLKPGGILVINVPQKYTVYTLYKHWQMIRNKCEWGKEGEFSYIRLKKMGIRYGLKLIKVLGYGYWFHPLEIMWVLRSIVDKVQKVNPCRKHKVFLKLKSLYDELWSKIEKDFGYYFLRNIVVAFRK